MRVFMFNTERLQIVSAASSSPKEKHMENSHNTGGSFVIGDDGSRQLVERTKSANEAENEAASTPDASQTAQSQTQANEKTLESQALALDEVPQLKNARK
jgi:hypothetical protein